MLRPGEHACMLDAWPHEQRAAAITHLSDGLWAGERCIYVGPGHSLEAFGRALARAGVDVERARRRSELVLAAAEQYTPAGSFDPRAMLDGVQGLVDAARADGFAALRLACDMRWATEKGVELGRLVEYEQMAHGTVYPTPWLSALCFYPRGHFDERTLSGSLTAHPLVLRGQQPLDNAVYGKEGDARRPLEALLREAVGAACGPHGLHVLVADGHVDSAAVTADMVASWDHRATVVHDGESALEAAEVDPPDVALVDLGLPGLNGDALGPHLQEANTRMLIAMTTRGGWTERERARAAGFGHCLLKPFAPSGLARLLDEARRHPQTT